MLLSSIPLHALIYIEKWWVDKPNLWSQDLSFQISEYLQMNRYKYTLQVVTVIYVILNFLCSRHIQYAVSGDIRIYNSRI